MPIFRQKFPIIELEIGTSIGLAEELEGERFDFIIAVPTVDERFVSVPLFADQMVCLMPADHPLPGQAHVGYADFHRCNLIAHAENGRNRFYQGGVVKLPYTPVDCPPRLNIVNSQYSSSMA